MQRRFPQVQFEKHICRGPVLCVEFIGKFFFPKTDSTECRVLYEHVDGGIAQWLRSDTGCPSRRSVAGAADRSRMSLDRRIQAATHCVRLSQPCAVRARALRQGSEMTEKETLMMQMEITLCRCTQDSRSRPYSGRVRRRAAALLLLDARGTDGAETMLSDR